MLQTHELYMQRCLQLAKLGAGHVAPNPMVGSVLAYENRIIGEGYHKIYGEAHAEVNCIASVKVEDIQFIEKSTLYVSLEPCAHYGKTPPCSDLIIRKRIPNVVIGCRDPFKEVNGKGIEKLEAAGVNTVTGVLEKKCKELNKRFFTFHTKQRPYIILKWAQTSDKKIATVGDKRLKISNQFTDRLVHKWRAEEAAILVGTNTAVMDDPLLTNRLWIGDNPVRLVIDKELKLPADAKIFSIDGPTIVFNLYKSTIVGDMVNQVYYYKIDNKQSFCEQIAKACFQLNIQSILVEGGARLLQSFIDENLYDEIRIIINEDLIAGNGLQAPVIRNRKINPRNFQIRSDTINVSYN